MMIKRLFVDMDGTLAIFKRSASLETLYQKGYFLNLKPIINVLEAVRQLAVHNPNIEINILSAYLTDSPYAYAEKLLWLDKHLPEVTSEHRILIPFGVDKATSIKGGQQVGDYLLDDYTKNLVAWNTTRGIKLLNGINYSYGTWRGNRVRYDKPPNILARDLARIVVFGESIRDDKPISQDQVENLRSMNPVLRGRSQGC